MNTAGEAIRYLGIGLMDLPDREEEVNQAVEKAELYHRWSLESGEKNDFDQALIHLIGLDNQKLGEERVMRKYDRLLEVMAELLRLELQDAVHWFNFLCEHKMRLELRDISFPRELDSRIQAFMDREESLQNKAEESAAQLSRMELSDRNRERRKVILERFEKEREKVNQAIEGFYGRVRNDINSGNA